MDFHSLARKELQALCKKNKIPANMTNVAMADALQALQQVNCFLVSILISLLARFRFFDYETKLHGLIPTLFYLGLYLRIRVEY